MKESTSEQIEAIEEYVSDGKCNCFPNNSDIFDGILGIDEDLGVQVKVRDSKYDLYDCDIVYTSWDEVWFSKSSPHMYSDNPYPQCHSTERRSREPLILLICVLRHKPVPTHSERISLVSAAPQLLSGQSRSSRRLPCFHLSG